MIRACRHNLPLQPALSSEGFGAGQPLISADSIKELTSRSVETAFRAPAPIEGKARPYSNRSFAHMALRPGRMLLLKRLSRNFRRWPPSPPWAAGAVSWRKACEACRLADMSYSTAPSPGVSKLSVGCTVRETWTPFPIAKSNPT